MSAHDFNGPAPSTEPTTKAEHLRAVQEAVQALSAALDRSGTTRTSLIKDGHLIEAPTAVAAEARWVVPVAVTRAVWLDMIQWPESESFPQDEEGRWWDVLYMAARVAQRSGEDSTFRVELYRVPRVGQEPQAVELVVTVGPGDDGDPAVTLALPHEG